MTMKLFQIFRYTEEKTLATNLVEKLVKELPPRFLADGSDKLSVNKITRSLEKTYQDALGHQERGHRMGLVRRSVFANAFKWGLREKGYSTEFCDVATEGLLMELAKVPKA
jgi:hypothetical protein